MNTCVQAVTHAAFTTYVYANCRHCTYISFLYDFGTYISYLNEDFFLSKLLEDRPLSRVQIIRIHFVYC